MKKLFIWILSAALCVSLAACAGKMPSVPVDEAPESANDAITTAYQDKVAELEVESEDTLSWAQFACGTGEKVLAVTKKSFVYADGQTMGADIY